MRFLLRGLHIDQLPFRINKIAEPQKPKVVKALPPLKEIVAAKLEQAPISVVLQHSGAKTLRNDNKLVDRTLKLLHVVRRDAVEQC